MKNFAKFTAFFVLGIFLLLPNANAQSALITKCAKEVVEICAKKGGKETAKIGSEKIVKESLEQIVKEAGEESSKKVLFYVEKHGIDALYAIKVSPKNVIKALNDCPEAFQKNLLSAVNKSSNEIVANAIKKGGSDALILEAKYPSIGFKMAEFGEDFVKTMNHLPKEDVLRIVSKEHWKGLEAIYKADSAQFMNKIVPALKKNAKEAISILEKNPKVLLTGAALTAYLGSQDNIWNSISEPTKYTAYSIGTILAIAAACYLAIKLYFAFRKSKKKAESQ